ncbi:hypothetical protein [uncultured Prevotella sp.]|uniref:hypothetical protein n=1 Tax=uncultured Prevotella sp. TaxID=159272 RepID=UPI0025974604|nr:hypothetical protein [uncultured Prevotella sp.]
MKKIFSFLLMSAMLLAVGVSVASCSSDDEDDGIISEKRVEKYITGYKWYKDGNKKTEFRFYRNRLVSSMSGSGSITSGSLTYAESNFFGTWAVVDGKLVTTFTSGAYGGFDWNSILYGSLTITELRSNFKSIKATAPNGDPHELSSYMVSYGTGNDFVDYTDDSDHDGALEGTWWTTGYASDGTSANFTMTIGKKGKVRFTAPNINIDNTTTCTTKNGHVTFDLYLTQATRTRSYIYVREKNKIVFYNEDNAQSEWVWQKVE